MNETFRKSMAWLHTWAGVVIGSVLFAIFWMGTLSVFDREIDRWMQPATRLAPSTHSVSLDRVMHAVTSMLPADASQWRIDLPTERVPVLRLSHQDGAGNTIVRQLDPASYKLIPDQGTKAGTGFIFVFHYSLHLKWMDFGEWLVGLAGMAMLVLLVSGVLIHKKIFAEFFTFRPKRHLQRSSLDLHNLTGVIGLPFHFVMTLSGLIIFMGAYFPQAHLGAYGSGNAAKATYTAETLGRYTRARTDLPGALASLDAMVGQAEREWGGGRPYLVRVWHPGDANSYVELRRSVAHDITMNLDQIYFDAGTGAVLHRFAAGPVMSVQRFISGLHFVQFEHWTLRWLYFLAGLSGCVMIATGFIFWLGARRAQHAKQRLVGVRVVETLTVGSITGIVVATLAFFVANRLLPPGSNFAGQDRAALEMWAFYLVWLATFGHAAWRRAHPATQPARRAWREQCAAIAVLAVAAVLLNGFTTGDHLLKTLSQAYWPVAGMDLLLLFGAGLALWSRRRLGRPPANAKAAAGARQARGGALDA